MVIVISTVALTIKKNEEVSYEETTKYGYFSTLDAREDTQKCMEEVFSMKFYADNRIEAESKANVHTNDGTMEETIWQHVGFSHGNDISLSYLSKKNRQQEQG